MRQMTALIPEQMILQLGSWVELLKKSTATIQAAIKILVMIYETFHILLFSNERNLVSTIS
jgi:hypothetical protein